MISNRKNNRIEGRGITISIYKQGEPGAYVLTVRGMTKEEIRTKIIEVFKDDNTDI